MSCQPHRVTPGQSNSGHKQIHISILFSHIGRKQEREREGERERERGDRKGESNDSPEIPDRRMTSNIPGLPSGPFQRKAATNFKA